MKKIIASSLCSVLLLTGLGTNSAFATEKNNFEEQREIYNQVKENSIADVFSQIENIPDEILNTNNETEINEYLKKSNSTIRVGNDESLVRVKRGWWDCSLAISALLVTTAIPVAKLVKIKKLINTLGGGAEAAKVIWGASLSSEKWAALGGVAKDLVLELVGINSVKKACFDN
ncbi:hypothetical protein [Bacillus wiedmannii]|uniref:hypothetical protein n=1 Tax=Bacillus wiedmannii TaxID=1890302 RepID=UPI000BED1916|nr:hypothetical protein [Bacillus wiedmannii]PEF36175.1 hypothetical protein CON72_16655 [Bacillus wiedmannii]